jgi:Flp pilus assembly pilin Flp
MRVREVTVDQIRQLDLMISRLRQFLTDESGQDVVEYSLMLVLIGTLVLIYLTGVGLNVATIMSKIGTKLETMSNSMK